MSDVLPNYVPPCLSEARSSLESFWRYPPDFGECYPPPSDSQVYPCLTPVYNGKVLDLNAEFVHASLSGISIKHYYGKCVQQESEEDIALYGGETEDFDYDWVDEDDIKQNSSLSMTNVMKNDGDATASSTATGSFDYRESFYVEGQPLCTLPKINHRNSFWNIHRPELCKLTWGQKYVGTSTVTEHLHEHLLHHGMLCVGFHTEEERAHMLNRELDEYVRLKVLEDSRKLPPDEPMFDLKSVPKKSKLPINPGCKNWSAPEVKIPTNENERFLQLTDDEDEEVGKRIRRSKEEFCLTIGRHIRKPPMVQQVERGSEEFITPQLSSAGEEEVGAYFFYNWYIFHPHEEEYGGEAENRQYDTESSSDVQSLTQPCPPLMMDEFCRAAGKVDFSDLRCDPDF